MKIFITVFLTLGVIQAVSAQVETVTRPNYTPATSTELESDFDYNIPGILVTTPEETTNPGNDASETSENNGEVTITTELGTISIVLDQGITTSSVDLSDVVREINADYVEAEAGCTTGSWLANIWCRISAWWG